MANGLTEGIVLFENEEHKFIHLGFEKEGIEEIFTNQYLIVHKGEGILLDPGGVHVYPRVLANVSEFIDPDNITMVFYTHQDPDVSSGIALWNSTLKNAKFYISMHWIRFVPHFGVYDKSSVVPIPDNGMELSFKDGTKLKIIPAHFLHSLGNFTLYDPISKILFSGDIGVGLVQPTKDRYFVENFSEYVKFMETFHKRYMASNIAIKKWLSIVSNLEVEIMAPQHGLLFRKNEYHEFLRWFEKLNCGVDIISDIYGV